MKTSFVKNISLIAAIIALCVIGLGAFTRLLDAGLGCPDWPGCYGHVVPNAKSAGSEFVAYKAWAEMIHRYAVSVLSLFILTIVISVFAKFRSRTNIIFSVLLIVLTAYQIMLGQWTVTLKLLPIIVSQHLLGGFFILSCLWMIYLNARHGEERFTRRSNLLIVLTSLGLLFLIFQISLGAWTSTNYASLSCSDFPFCMNDKPFMPFHLKEAYHLFSRIGMNYQGGVLAEPVRQTIQMVHRMGALIVSIYLFILFIIGHKQTPHLQKILYTMIAILLLQLCLGIINVLFKLPLLSGIFHTLGAALLLLSLLTYLFYLLPGESCAR